MATATETEVTLKLSPEASVMLRELAAQKGDGSSRAMSDLVEDLVRRRMLSVQIDEIRERFADMSPEQIDELVEEALAWARSPEGRACE